MSVSKQRSNSQSNTRIKRAVIVAFAVCLTAADDTVSQAGKPVYVGQAKVERVTMLEIDHTAWNDLLKKIRQRQRTRRPSGLAR